MGPGVFALYAHIAPGQVTVHVGQQVRAGQVIGELGNSGNSTAPHLHFHLMNGPSPLTSQGIPFEFRTYTLLAQPGAGGDIAPEKPPLVLHDSYPLYNTVIGFPGAASAPVSEVPAPAPENSGLYG